MCKNVKYAIFTAVHTAITVRGQDEEDAIEIVAANLNLPLEKVERWREFMLEHAEEASRQYCNHLNIRRVA